MKGALLALTLSALVIFPAISNAECPASNHFSVTRNGLALGVMAGTATLAFVGGAGTNMCGRVAQGAATYCLEFANGTGMTAYFRAIWPSTAARTMDATGGCVFTCPGGTCRVNRAGLPVELLSFGAN